VSSLEVFSGQQSRYDGNKSDWATPPDVPDPEVLPTITGYNVLIRPVDIKKETKGGIIIVDSITEDIKFLTNVGQVKAMGPQCYHDPNVKPQDGAWFPHGRYKSPWCKVGDYVVWGKHQGVRLVVKGVTFVLLQDELVLMVVNDPSDINPMLNAFARK
jgi:co-chaperonin GroES (HSP10)